MKKVIFALAAVVALAACSQEDVIIADKGAAIGFDTFVENSTRSVNDPSYSSAQGGKMFTDFAVFGYVEGAVLLDGVRVAKNGADMDADDYAGQTSTAWKYEGTQYWIAGANYNFNAVAPLTGGNWEVVENDDDTVFTDATKTTISFTNNGTTDLLYATAAQEGKASGNAVVGFNFRHVLSKVKFSFVNDYNASNATIRVKDVKITDAYKTADAELTSVTNWSNQAVESGFVLNFGNAVADDATSTDALAFAYGTTLESYNELLMIPGQGATAFEIKNADNSITPAKGYTIQFTVELLVSEQEVAEYTHTINTAFIPEAGKSYDLKATIKPENIDPEHAQEAIEFTVNSIVDWDEDHDGKENTEAGDTDGDTQVDTNLPLN